MNTVRVLATIGFALTFSALCGVTGSAAAMAGLNGVQLGPNMLPEAPLLAGTRKMPPLVVGSAIGRAHAMQRTMHAPFPSAPLFVADAALNAVVVYDSTLTGTVAPNMLLVGSPSNGINGPYAVATGLDCIPGCAHYLWVANFGNNTIEAFMLPISPASLPVRLFKAKPTCPGAISQPVGIVHIKGFLFITNTNTASITVWKARFNGKKCPIRTIAGSSTQLVYPHGPSVSFPGNPNMNYVFASDQSAVTGHAQLANGNVAPAFTWSLPGVYTQGTATDWNLGNLWLASNASPNYPSDALWLCRPLPLPGPCPTTQAITGNLTGLNFPGLPAVSEALGTVFVPNINGGNVTEYSESVFGNVPPVATFTGLTFGYGAAIENAPD